ncbi:MAG: hypothetical protein IKL65_00175 [Bacilli bacterium]|nr:hypothetical protein [Bacilli bacterium]
MLNKNDKLKLYLGQLKYQKEKRINIIDLIEKYIYRIEENISEIKCVEGFKDEEYKNKDLVMEVEELLKELSE